MKIVHRKRLQEFKYNQLLEQTPEASIYNHLQYLDYLSDNVEFLIVGDYQAAMALPYTKRLNSKCLTNPVFSRVQDWLGPKPKDFTAIIKFLLERYDRCDFSIGNVMLEGEHVNKKVTQSIELAQNVHLNSQAKRNVKKLANQSYQITDMGKKEALDHINSMLIFKVGGVRDIEVTRFNRLVHYFQNPVIVAKGLYWENELLAIGLFVQWRNKYLYIKGTTTEAGRSYAAMQTLMLNEIEWAKLEGLDFEFEGSNVPSVAQFNESFGAKNIEYINLNWDNSSGIFPLVRKLLGK